MKKHDEGYALAFVLVVVTILCVVALSIMSVSLSNLQSEKATVDRMQEKYTAQGEIEKVIARLDVIRKTQGGNLLWTAEDGFVGLCPEQTCQIQIIGADQILDGDQDYLLVSVTTVGENMATVSCILKISGDIDVDHIHQNISIKKLNWSYESYSVEQGGGDDA